MNRINRAGIDNSIRHGTIGEAREKSRIRTAALVRNPTQIFNTLSLSRKTKDEKEKEMQKQTWLHQEVRIKEVLTQLRSGTVNLLIATCKLKFESWGFSITSTLFLYVFEQR